jgi:cytoskeleton protein RodZ
MQSKTKNNDNGAHKESEQQTPGSLLRRTREAAGLTLDEVAHDLHLSREVVLSLEEDDHEALGAPVFVRGHLRNYARLMGLPDDSVVQNYAVAEPEPEEFRTLSALTEVKPAASLSNFVLLVAFGIIVLVAVVYLTMGNDDIDPANPKAKEFETAEIIEPDEELNLEAPQLEVEQEKNLEVGQPADNEETITGEFREGFSNEPVESESLAVTAAPEPVKPAVTEVVAVADPAPLAEPPVELVLRFSDECWVEISDAQRRLLYGLEKPGSDVQLTGVPPFKFFLGNAASVDILFAGEVYALPRSARSGKTARFSITAEQLAAITGSL